MKKLSSSPIVVELKTEMVKEHLGQVRSLIERWQSQLTAPDPLDSKGGDRWVWKSVYVPPLEEEVDDNHMVRKHLHSRMLWRHHSDWQQELNQIFRILPEIQEEARGKLDDISKKSNLTFTSDALCVALIEAFRLLCYGKISNLYYPHNPGTYGIVWGPYCIEEKAASEEEGKIVTETHRGVVYGITKLEKMEDLAKTWRRVRSLEERMKGLIKRAIKSNDILYPCRFCKHLWVA